MILKSIKIIFIGIIVVLAALVAALQLFRHDSFEQGLRATRSTCAP